MVGTAHAHYTSIDNLRNILIGEELWLSNPLSMNEQSPLIIAPVEYLSREARLAWINQRLDVFTGTAQRSDQLHSNVGAKALLGEGDDLKIASTGDASALAMVIKAEWDK
jgi:hypothetical protein